MGLAELAIVMVPTFAAGVGIGFALGRRELARARKVGSIGDSVGGRR